MRLALLGDHSELLGFAKLLAQLPRYQPTIACETGGLTAPLQALFPGLVTVADWSQLLDSQAVVGWDAICFGGIANRQEQDQALRKLALLGKPIIVLHPVHDSLIAAYELELYCREGQAKLIPWLPLRLHPVVIQWQDFLRKEHESPVGTIQAVTIERHFPEPSRSLVLGQLARDCDLLRAMLGEVSQVMTLAGASGEVGSAINYTGLSVQLTTRLPILTRWVVASPASKEPGILIAQGTAGQLRWQLPDVDQSGQCEMHTSQQTTTLELEPWSLLQSAEQVLDRAAQQLSPQLKWNDAARSVEIIDAVERSLLRGRKIEVRVEESDDLGNFKGIMASAGCGLLMFGLLVLFLCAIAGVVLRTAGWQAGANFIGVAWPWFLVLLLVAFLALQLVVKFSVKPETKKRMGE